MHGTALSLEQCQLGVPGALTLELLLDSHPNK